MAVGEDTCPPRCKQSSSTGWQCKRAATINKDGSWASQCQKHKDDQRHKDATRKKRSVQITQGHCADCDETTDLGANGKEYKKYCNDCSDTTSSIYQTIWRIRAAKRAFLDEEAVDLKKRRLEDLEIEKDSILEELDDHEQAGNDIETLQAQLLAFIDL